MSHKKPFVTGVSYLRRTAASQDGSCAMEFTRAIHQLKMTNPRHRNEQLTIISTASYKRCHSCPRHWCFEKLISHQLGLSMPALPKLHPLLMKHRQCQRTPLAIIRSFPRFQLAAHACLHSWTLTSQLLRPLRSGSARQLLGWPFCCLADSVIKTKSVWNPPSQLASRPVCASHVLTQMIQKRRIEERLEEKRREQ